MVRLVLKSQILRLRRTKPFTGFSTVIWAFKGCVHGGMRSVFSAVIDSTVIVVVASTCFYFAACSYAQRVMHEHNQMLLLFWKDLSLRH